MGSLLRRIALSAGYACAALGSVAAYGQAVQVLDSVDVFGPNAGTGTVLEMGFRDPLPRVDFNPLNVSGTALLACQRAANQGLYCVDGTFVRYWPNTKQVPFGDPVPDIELLDCRDPALKLDTKKPNPCTSITVDLNGSLWLAGRKANSHSLVKVVEESTLGTCSGPWVRLAKPAQDLPHTTGGATQAVPSLCAREYAPGRPLLVDINPVDGEVATNYTRGAGVLGLEERKTVVFFPDQLISGAPAPAVSLASGKTAWGLIGSEQLLSATFLQLADTEAVRDFLVVTTTLGRVLAKRADGVGAAFKVFDMPSPASCTSTTQHYSVRVSSQSGRVYVSDRRCRQILALEWVTRSETGFAAACPTSPSSAAFCLVNAEEPSAPGTDVTIATGTTSPDGVSVAPGIGIDLRDCSAGKPPCPLVGDGLDANLFNAAELTDVVIEQNGFFGMTVFQVKNVPDCRTWPDGPVVTDPACQQAGVIRLDGSGNQYLNVYPLLPLEVTLQFDPVELLISHRYRGQLNDDGKRTIDLFFGIVEPGVQFRGTFSGSFDVADLTGSNLGCGGSTLTRPDLALDITTTVSETYGTVGGPDGDPVNEHADMLVNTDCTNPTKISGGRWSLYAYNMEPTPAGDAVYAKLVRSLFDDLRDAQLETACTNIDGGSAAPLGPVTGGTCSTLLSRWQNASIKLDSCISGSTYPRQSAAVNNCNSFLSQLDLYKSTLDSASLVGNDPANRKGELQVRVQVVRYMFVEHFTPSIPPAGFCDNGVPCP